MASGEPREMGAMEVKDGLRFAPGRAVIFMLAAVFCLAVLDAGVKWLTADYPIPQIGFLRYCIGICFAIALAMRFGGIVTLRTRRLGGHALRSVLNMITMITFYYALRLMPLADAVAVGFAAPLFMTALSVPLLRERVGPRRWAAIVVGFFGVLLIAGPGSGPDGIVIGWGALLALISAFTYALTLITSRQLSRTELSHTILFYYSIGVILVMGSTLPFNWVTPLWEDVWIFVLVGVSGSIGQYCLNQAFRYGEVSFIAPLEYTSLIWAGLFGIAFWGDIPTWSVLGGAAIVVAANLYVVRRESTVRRAAAR
jgi:drug/metabolite transporter (DMT)-like permease